MTDIKCTMQVWKLSPGVRVEEICVIETWSCRNFQTGKPVVHTDYLQGYLAYKKLQPPRTLQ